MVTTRVEINGRLQECSPGTEFLPGFERAMQDQTKSESASPNAQRRDLASLRRHLSNQGFTLTMAVSVIPDEPLSIMR
jgi:hypothetical protein